MRKQLILFSLLQLLIPILSVEEITKEKTAKIIPNAIGIIIGKERHVFSSFIKRDNSYHYLRKIWQAAKNDVGNISDIDSVSIHDNKFYHFYYFFFF